MHPARASTGWRSATLRLLRSSETTVGFVQRPDIADPNRSGPGGRLDLLIDFSALPDTVEVMIRFDAYRGIYLTHCHKREQADMGMMSNFEVV